jgi:hypothetical protein
MSTETSELNQSNDGGDSGEPRRRFGFLHADTGVDSGVVDRDAVTTDVEDDDATDDALVYNRTGDPDEVDPQPTFTPSASGPTTTLPDPREPVDGPVVRSEVVPDDVTGERGQLAPTTLDDTTVDDATTFLASSIPASTVPVSTVPASTAPASGAPLPTAAAFDPNAPLLGDPVGLRASWQQAAAEFVDDPRAAVADAAELVEHTVQTLIGALQQRQRQLRGQWETGTAAGGSGSGATAGGTNGTTDTEELRLLMQSYRALFNQLTAS